MALNLASKLLRNRQVCKKTLNCSLAAQANVKVKTYDEIPGPKAKPFVGNLFNLKQFGKNKNYFYFELFSFKNNFSLKKVVN